MDASDEHRYEILATLGRGGFGTVYRARFLGEGGFAKQVAIKILNDRMNGIEEVAGRLRDEARMLGLLEHRAIVRVDRLVQFNGRWAVVMEYVRGVDLGALLETGPVPVMHALEIVAEVASALAEAWEAKGPDGTPLGLVHRDVKPDNIHITASGDVKVLDFGIARAEFSRREAFTSDMRFGSPSYMAPERFDQTYERADEASTDVYSLGAVLYELVLGEAFGRTSPIESRHERFLEERLGKLRRVRCPEDVIGLIGEMMAYDRTARPSAREVERRALALMQGMEGERLRFWAERRVPPLIREGSPVDGDISRFLDEEGTAAFDGAESLVLRVGPTTTVPTGPSRRTALLAVALVVAVILAAGGTGGMVARALLPASTVTEVDVPLPVPATEGVGEADEAVPDPVPEPVPEPIEAPAPAPSTAPAAAPAPPVTERGAAEAPAEDAPHGVVALAGDARQVVLVGVRARYAVPGRVPPGRYTVAADFGTGSLRALDAVEVEEGARVNLRCDGLLETCAVY